MKLFERFFIISYFIVSGTCLQAQNNTEFAGNTTENAVISPDATDSAGKQKQKDVIDIFQTLLKKHEERSDKSSVHASALPAAGYSLQTGFAVVVSGNLALYTGRHNHEEEKISNIQTSFTYSQYHQIIFPIQASIWTKENKYNVVVDWRYLKYPSQTFGLGGRSNINNGYTIDFNYVKLHQTVLKKVTDNFYAGVGYYYDHFWNITQVDPPAGLVTDFSKYGFSKKVTASGVAFRLLYDSRVNQINPANGWYSNIVYRPNYTSLGSDNNWQSLLVELRKYIKLPGARNNVLAFWSYNWLTFGSSKTPYLLLPSTGWDDFYNTGRGYIQGRYRGRNMIYLESEYRFGLTNNGLLGGVVFANAQSFSRELSKQFAVIAPGVGAGIRLKLNKFSGTNVGLDYGFGINGSKGISVNLGEVF